MRAQVLAEGDRQAVAAYELTFTPVKSVSVLGVLGGDVVWQQVMDAHRAAVDTALEYVQDHASYSRAGVNGVRQIDTQGLVIAAFEHRMSREQDPNIHTHAIVANRVLCADGKWRTVDGRAVYAASVGARAVYEQALEVELAQRLGVRFSVDERRTIREVVRPHVQGEVCGGEGGLPDVVAEPGAGDVPGRVAGAARRARVVLTRGAPLSTVDGVRPLAVFAAARGRPCCKR